jgi:hypothetical protein
MDFLASSDQSDPMRLRGPCHESLMHILMANGAHNLKIRPLAGGKRASLCPQFHVMDTFMPRYSAAVSFELTKKTIKYFTKLSDKKLTPGVYLKPVSTQLAFVDAIADPDYAIQAFCRQSGTHPNSLSGALATRQFFLNSGLRSCKLIYAVPKAMTVMTGLQEYVSGNKRPTAKQQKQLSDMFKQFVFEFDSSTAEDHFDTFTPPMNALDSTDDEEGELANSQVDINVTIRMCHLFSFSAIFYRDVYIGPVHGVSTAAALPAPAVALPVQLTGTGQGKAVGLDGYHAATGGILEYVPCFSFSSKSKRPCQKAQICH